MNHLSPFEVVDLIEGRLDAARAAHADRCEACRRSSDELRELLDGPIAAADVPEPSPLFWDHLSARVRDAVAQEAPPAAGWMAWRPAMLITGFAAVTLLAVGSLMLRPIQDSTRSANPPAVVAADTATGFDTTIDADGEVWEVLSAAAADLELDAAREAGMAVPPAAIDRAVQRLTGEELNELGRLLQSELKRAGNGA